MKRRLLFYGSLLLAMIAFVLYATVMPGTQHGVPMPEPSAEMTAMAADLEAHVVMLSQTIGERRAGHGDALNRAREYIAATLGKLTEGGRSP